MKRAEEAQCGICWAFLEVFCVIVILAIAAPGLHLLLKVQRVLITVNGVCESPVGLIHESLAWHQYKGRKTNTTVKLYRVGFHVLLPDSGRHSSKGRLKCCQELNPDLDLMSLGLQQKILKGRSCEHHLTEWGEYTSEVCTAASMILLAF